VAAKVVETVEKTEPETDKIVETVKEVKADEVKEKPPVQNSNTTQSTEVKSTNTNITINTSILQSWITYKVQKGDTLWKIATKHNVTVDQVKNNNNLAGDKIIVGQTLKIKSK